MLAIAVFVQSFRSFNSLHSFTHTATPTPRKSWQSFAHYVPFHSFHFRGLCLFLPANPCGCSSVPLRFTQLQPPHTYTPYRSFVPIHSIRSFLPALAFSNAQRSSKKVRQTGCRQHPATALRASCVRGTRSTRIGSHTKHRLHTSFRFTSLACSLAINAGSRLFLPFSV
jgi:hypothetical protein